MTERLSLPILDSAVYMLINRPTIFPRKPKHKFLTCTSSAFFCLWLCLHVSFCMDWFLIWILILKIASLRELACYFFLILDVLGFAQYFKAVINIASILNQDNALYAFDIILKL